MGVEPFLVASSVNAIMAQRLIRRVCTNCKAEREVNPEALEALKISHEEAAAMTLYEGTGCVDCSNTGYKGRTGVFEVMPISPAIREMILNRAPTNEIKEQAMQEGMLSLRMDGMRKLKLGITSVEEVLKETAADD
jgi:type IV pilus assembly protein PilB